MNKKQLLVAIILFVLHFLTWITNKEFWPISNYPMYSYAFATNSFSSFNMVGIYSDGKEEDFSVTKYLFPFWLASMREAIMANKAANSQVLFNDLFKVYKVRRENKFSDWPNYSGFRLYKKTYERAEYLKQRLSGIGVDQIIPNSNTIILEARE